jgi:hypothetical protein
MIGCMTLIVFLVLVFAGFMVFAYKNPYYRGMAECMIKMKDVGAALDRYEVSNDVYPDRLQQLVPDYLPQEALHCPADKSSVKSASYIYHKVAVKAPDGAILLECRMHKPRRAEFPSIIYYHKGGSITMGTNDLTGK